MTNPQSPFTLGIAEPRLLIWTAVATCAVVTGIITLCATTPDTGAPGVQFRVTPRLRPEPIEIERVRCHERDLLAADHRSLLTIHRGGRA